MVVALYNCSPGGFFYLKPGIWYIASETLAQHSLYKSWPLVDLVLAFLSRVLWPFFFVCVCVCVCVCVVFLFKD